MKSPFPGVDPYLEGQKNWADFHPTFIVCWREQIAKRLPSGYAARIGEHIYLARDEGVPQKPIIPDVLIDRDAGAQRAAGRSAGGLTIEPVIIPNFMGDPVREGFIEIIRREDRSVIAVLELLSPTNKVGEGRGEYRAKRESIMQQPIHLVELDLLLMGRRVELRRDLPAGHFYAMVSRAERRPDCEVYAWGLRDPLPTIPIPLSAPDPDLMLNLQDVFDVAYERGGYDALVNYSVAPELPLADDAVAWVRERLQARGA